MESLDTKKMLMHAEHCARVVGEMLRAHIPSTLSSIDKDIKIDADKNAHELILEALQKTGIPVLSEEDDVHTFENDLQWIVDPLDGSLNFLRGIPNCAISIALVRDMKPHVGVIYDFNRDEMYTGIVGEGAWRNGEPIVVSNIEEKGGAVLMSGFPSFTNYSHDALETYITFIQSFKKLRLIGSAALSLAYVAGGRADAYYEKDIKIWDVAAGLALVEASGGSYTMSDISPEGTCTITATNNKIAV